ncbi:MAG: SLBB domain-containing protein, partial [Halieaceae bacterium]|nr:SLBB domain-containing protein [Halieaceae bacterium]
MNSHDHKTRSASRQRRRWLRALAVWLGLCGVVPALQAQDNLDPVFETLPYLQKAAARRAAPSGMDKPLDVPTLALQQPAPVLEESNLEQQADEKRRAISLDEASRSQALEQPLAQFGYDMFREVPGTFAPISDIPVPADYRIAAGDTLVVQLYGKRNVEYRLVVTREGRVLVPEVGPVDVAGLTFEEVKSLVAEGFEQRVIGARAVVTMGDLRALQVRLAGDVVKPGVYTISALSGLVDALLVTGGIQHTGSLRDIQVKRRGELVARYDLYDLLLRGDTAADITLEHNDVIFVPPLGDIVYVGGEVQRPGIYELRGERRLEDVLALAGGLTATASIKDSLIERVIPGRYRTLVSLDGRRPLKTEVKAGDFLRILPVDDTLDGVALLSGHVKRPGGYQLRPGMRVSDLVPDARVLMPNADLDFALIKREQAGTRRTEIVYVNLAKAMRQPGGEGDLLLRPRDELVILRLDSNRADELAAVVRELDIQSTDYRPAATFTLQGHLRHSGRLPLQPELRLVEALAIGGGIRRGTDMDYGVLARTQHPSGVVVLSSFSLADALRNTDSADNPVIQPGDRIYLFDQEMDRSALLATELAALEAQGDYNAIAPIVYANGRVNHPGRYPLEPGMRASDLLCAARGLTENGYGVRAELTRYRLTMGERRQVDQWSLDTPRLISLCNAQRQAAVRLGQHEVRRRAETWGTVIREAEGTFARNLVAPVYFDSGREALPAEQLELLRQAVQDYARRSRNVTVIVAGHTDDQPLSAELREVYRDNLGLSQARAARVADYIRQRLGLAEQQVRFIGYGDTQPLAGNDSAAGRAENRRVEISLQLDDDYLEQQPAGETPPANDAQTPSLLAMYYDDSINPLLQADDQLTFVGKPGWIENARVTLEGEINRPGVYVIDRGETLCSVMQRAGGVTADAYLPGAVFTRASIRAQQQETLDGIQSRLDDLLVDLSLSHSYNNADKTPASDHKAEYLRVIKQLQAAEPNGRMVIDLEKASTCDQRYDVALEDGDTLTVGTTPNTVYVAGQVYVPTSHLYTEKRTVADYLELSGGATVLGHEQHAYVIG